MEITVAKTSPIGITPERQDYSYLPARDQHEHESEGPARAGDRREEVGVRKTHPKHSQVTLKGWGGVEKWANQGVGECRGSSGGSRRSRVSSTEVTTEGRREFLLSPSS